MDMGRAEHSLADRARRLLLARGGQADELELLAGLFGTRSDSPRWSGLVQGVLAPLPDVRRRADGRWELVSDGAGVAARPTELAFVTLASTATAADPWRARLAALAAVRVRGGRVDGVFEAVFNPGCRLPRYLTGTGLTQAEADEAPPFADLADELLYFLDGAALVGLEIRAQLALLGHELSRLDRPGLRNRLLDLAQLAERVELAAAKPNLPALAEAAGLTHPRPYCPAADARIAARLAGRLLARAEARGLAAEALFLDEDEVLPGALLHADPPPAPDGPGIYLLRAADGSVLYVGKARNLRRRLAAYHHRPLGLLRRLEGLAAAVERVETIGAASELEALIVEARLLRQHRPAYNTQRRVRPPAVFLRADLSAEGAALAACRRVSADGACYLGPFRTAGAAAAALRLARELFPGLRSRARARADERRPLVLQALRFLTGQKRAELDRLRAEQRALAAAGERVALAGSRALLRRALDFELDRAAIWAESPGARLLVLSPDPSGDIVAHVIADGRLRACFRAIDPAEARARAADCSAPAIEPDELDDEPNIVARWLCGLGREHHLEQLS